MRSRKTLPASRRVQGHRSKPSSQGALRAAGGRGGLSIGPRGQCPSFLFSSRGRWSAGGHGSPPPSSSLAALLLPQGPTGPAPVNNPGLPARVAGRPPPGRPGSQVRNLGLTLRPAEQLGGAEASQCAGRVGFSPPRPLPAGGGSRRHWRLSGVQTCASLSRAWFTCSPLELFKNNHIHTNFPWETAQEAPPRGRGGGGSVWADPGRGRQLG